MEEKASWISLVGKLCQYVAEAVSLVAKQKATSKAGRKWGWGIKVGSLGAYFPWPGPTPKVSTTIQSSATIWRTSI